MYLGEGQSLVQRRVAQAEKNGEGCLRDSQVIVSEVGAKDWWVKIKTADGKIGWVKVEENFDGMDAFA
jgi:hypothetical protein